MAMSPSCPNAFAETVRSLDAHGFHIAEATYRPGQWIPRHVHDRAGFCLVLAGGFDEQGARSTLRCAPATLLFHPAGATHANVISNQGSRCLNVTIDPSVMASLPPRVAAFEAFAVSRHGVAHWLAYRLRAELRAPDDLTPLVIHGVGLALLGELARRPSARADSAPPAWLERVRAQVAEEFRDPPSLAALAATAAYTACTSRGPFASTTAAPWASTFASAGSSSHVASSSRPMRP
jgi:AraC family transcriptional regulator